MGKIAEALGVGVPGTVRILLGKGEYVAGDVLSGTIRLVVTSRIEHAQAIVLELHGRETLEWDESQRVDEQDSGTCTRYDSNSTRMRDSHAGKRVTSREKETYTIVREQICVDVPPRSYDPGAYEFPFTYQLPHRDLVPSFEFRCSSIDFMGSVHARAVYDLSVRVPVSGVFTADMSHTLHPIIRDEPKLKVPRSISTTVSQPVYFLYLFNKGSCDLTATLEQDVVPLGGLARIEAFVTNNSSRCVDSVQTKLTQTVTLNQYRASRGSSEAPSSSHTISTSRSSSVDPGTGKKLALSLPIQYKSHKRGELIPTMRSHFLNFSYELSVTCAQSWCGPDAKAVFPIVLTTKTV